MPLQRVLYIQFTCFTILLVFFIPNVFFISSSSSITYQVGPAQHWWVATLPFRCPFLATYMQFLLFQLHELDKRRMNFWVTIWKITIACLGFSPRFHSAYCKWISTRASIMDRNLFFVFTNYIETSERLYKYSTCTCIQPFSSVASRNGIQAVAIIWS